MRLLLFLLIVACSEEQSVIKEQSNAENEQFDPWTVSTLDEPTIDTYFVNRQAGYPSDCVVLDAKQQLLDKLETMLGKKIGSDGYKEAKQQYREQLVNADILCMSKYYSGQQKANGQLIYRYFQSFYNGTATVENDKRSYRVLCFLNKDATTNSNEYVCRDYKQQLYNEGKNFTIISDQSTLGDRGVNAEIASISFYENKTYDGNKKLLRVPVDDLQHYQRSVFPESSPELPEFTDHRGHNELTQYIENVKYITEKVIDKDGSYKFNTRGWSSILSRCSTKASGIDRIRTDLAELRKEVKGFKEVPVCQDLSLNKYNGRCKGEAKKAKITACKLQGRGILIKRGDNNILRVADCEYQPAAMHFYCSGKEKESDKNRIYFERYGVMVDVHELPPSGCRAKNLRFISDSIGCGTCSKYDIVKDLADRGCDHRLVKYCQHFASAEDDLSLMSGTMTRPRRCELANTCSFRVANGGFDSEYACRYDGFAYLMDEINCTLERSYSGNRCHFKEKR